MGKLIAQELTSASSRRRRAFHLPTVSKSCLRKRGNRCGCLRTYCTCQGHLACSRASANARKLEWGIFMEKTHNFDSTCLGSRPRSLEQSISFQSSLLPKILQDLPSRHHVERHLHLFGHALCSQCLPDTRRTTEEQDDAAAFACNDIVETAHVALLRGSET